MKREYIDKVALVYLKNRRMLHTRSYGKDTFFTPGGKREGNETDAETLIREIKEELDVDILPDTISYYKTFAAHAHGKPDHAFVRIKFYMAEFTGQPQPTSEIEEIAYLDFSVYDTLTETGKLIVKDLKDNNLID
ncbi:NUDIX domain-containing protein [Candidatus Saccharibacteria bacterium]|nr:NUDIX domain-containing protein [Candidatus Saccharibacteria bacterium]